MKRDDFGFPIADYQPLPQILKREQIDGMDDTMSAVPVFDQVNTRRFPRTLFGVDAAYPQSPQYAQPIDYDAERIAKNVDNIILCGFFAFLALIILVPAFFE